MSRETTDKTWKQKAEARMNEEIRLVNEAYEATWRNGGEDGWNSPPRQMPRAAELAMGIYYDPDRNTR